MEARGVGETPRLSSGNRVGVHLWIWSPHGEDAQRPSGTILFFYTKSQFMRMRLDDSREAGSLPRKGSTTSSCFQEGQLNVCETDKLS